MARPGRSTPAEQADGVARVLAGESAADVAEALGVPATRVRQWVYVHKQRQAPTPKPKRPTAVVTEAGAAPVQLVPALNPSSLDPLGLLEHDVALCRRLLTLAEEAGSMSALAPLLSQLRQMQAELAAMRASVPEDKVDTDAERVLVLTDHMRVLRWCRKVLEDRQALTMMRRAVAERTDT